MLLEWRAAMGSIGLRGDHNIAEWQYQMAVCSQTFEDLPDQLEQLVIGREGRGRQRRQIPLPPGEIVKPELQPVNFRLNAVVGRIFSSQKRAIYCCRGPSINISFASKSEMQRGWVQEETQRRPAQAATPPPPPPPRVNAPTPF
ncbi:hypothetical protein E2320_019545 [Naja naja]|nr:hypothetical protein E2320_019545 [Naja naja]